LLLEVENGKNVKQRQVQENQLLAHSRETEIDEPALSEFFLLVLWLAHYRSFGCVFRSYSVTPEWL